MYTASGKWFIYYVINFIMSILCSVQLSAELFRIKYTVFFMFIFVDQHNYSLAINQLVVVFDHY